jgi:Flp pilus assembly secretin CpaC
MICNYSLSLPHRWASVNRTVLVRFPSQRDKVSCLPLMRTLRQAASAFLSTLLFCAQLSAQGPPSPQFQSDSVHVDPKRAQKLAELGDRAAAAGRLQDALAAYEEAARLAPQDAAIVERGAALRSNLVRGHVEAAERLALANQMGPATEELAAALRIDPGNTIVAERLAQLKSMADEPLPKPVEEISGLPKLQPQPGRHDLNLRGETKTVYEELAIQFGVKAAFDPELAPRNTRLRVDNVDFYTAVTILSAQTATFWRPLNPTLMFVAPDNPEKRRQYGLEAEQTFPLSSAVSPEEATEMLRILREITGATRIGLDTRSRTITMRDTPEKLALARELIQQVDKARGEVMLEIELLEVDRNKARQLGISTPYSTQLIPLTSNDLNKLKSSTSLINLLTNLAQVFAAKGISPTTSLLPFGGGLSTFLLTVPSSAANFSDSLSLVQSGRQVLLRAQEGKPATFFVGDRFPITLSLLSGSLGTGSAASLGALAGTTFPETQFTVGNNPTALVANNFTGGSLPDLAVVFNDANTHTFTILQNQDNGNFAVFTPQPITLDSNNETGQVAIATGVFRSDTTKFSTTQPPDVVLVNSSSKNISVLLGNMDAAGKANGTFTEAVGSPFAVGTNPSSVVVADFNGDGFLDIAVAHQGDNSISVFKGNGDGTFVEFPGSPFKLTNTSTITESGPVAMVSANFRNKFINTTNNAPEVDLAIVNQASNNVTILLSSVDQNKNVTFSEAQGSPIPVGTSPVAIATGDLNADSVPDLAIVNQGDNTVSVLLGSSNADGTFAAAASSPLQTAANPAGIVIANFANGAVPDLAVTNKGVNTLGVYLGQGHGTFASRIEINVPTAPSAIIAPTLTSSGLPDVALTATGDTANKGVVAVIQDSSSFANNPGSATGVGQTPYPGSEYVDLGVKIKATPSLHPNNEVTLQLEFEIRALSGSAVNGIPIISNRTLTQTVRVKENEPTLIGGITDVEETRSITGLPGFAGIPVVGYAFGVRRNSLQDTELLIVVTPRRLRLADHLTRTIFAGRGDAGTGRAASPGTLQSPTPQTQP